MQLHAAHGYLLSAFVSPRTNRRKDAWGGNTEKRFRIIKEIYRRAREQVGDFPILVKLNGTEKSKGGMTMDESVKIAHLLEAVGCNGIEVSCGMIREGLYTCRGWVPWKMMIAENSVLSGLPGFVQHLIGFVAERVMKSSEPQKLFNVDAAKRIKEAVHVPVIVVGGIDNLPDIEQIIENGMADYVSMSRPLITEPNLVQKFKEKKQTQAKCINCNYCLMSKELIRCYYGKVPRRKIY